MSSDDAAASAARERRACEILAAYFEAERDGAEVSREALFRLHPELAAKLAEFLDHQDRLLGLTEPPGLPDGNGRAAAGFADNELIAPIGRSLAELDRAASQARPRATQPKLGDLREFFAPRASFVGGGVPLLSASRRAEQRLALPKFRRPP